MNEYRRELKSSEMAPTPTAATDASPPETMTGAKIAGATISEPFAYVRRQLAQFYVTVIMVGEIFM